MLDFNDAGRQSPPGGLIPDGTFCLLQLSIRRGGASLPNGEVADQGLFYPSKSSDAITLDCEFTVTSGPYARRKLWQHFTVAGGQVDERGVSKGWNISRKTLRAILESARGISPDDKSDTANAKRATSGFADFDGLEFVARIGVEKGSEGYLDKNRIAYVVTRNDPEWHPVMNGETVPPKPSGGNSAGAAVSRPPVSPPPWQSPETSALPPNRATGPAWLRD